MQYELKIALRYLRSRNKSGFISVTTVFTAVGVMIGVAALVVTLSIMSGLEASLKERVLALTPQIQITSANGSITDYREIQKKIAPIPEISGSDPFLIGQGMLSSGRGIGGVVARGVEPDNPVVISEWSKYMATGSFRDLSPAPMPAGSNSTPDRIIIGVTLAEKLKAKVGDPTRLVAPIVGQGSQLTTKTGPFVVAGIFDSGMTYVDTNLVFIDLSQAQEYFGRPGRADGIDVHLRNLEATGHVAQQLKQILSAPYRVRTWMEFNQSAAAGFGLLKIVYSMVLTLLIAVAAFNLIATLIMVVMEKRKDVAVLMAMGASAGEIRRVFVLKGLVVGSAGTLAGLVVAAIGCFALKHYHFIHIPREIYGTSNVPIAISPFNFVWVAGASMLLCYLATIYPARQASREMPVEVFRT